MVPIREVHVGVFVILDIIKYVLTVLALFALIQIIIILFTNYFIIKRNLYYFIVFMVIVLYFSPLPVQIWFDTVLLSLFSQLRYYRIVLFLLVFILLGLGRRSERVPLRLDFRLVFVFGDPLIL